jgi:hypothetical protein
MRKFALKIGFIVASLSIFMSSANADTYRWVDDSGVVNYSEKKPRGIAPERVTKVASEGKGRSQSPAAPAAVAAPVSQTVRTPSSNGGNDQNLSKEQQEMLSQLKTVESGRQQQLAKIRQDNCERSRRALDNLSANARIRVRGEDGGQRVLPEEERQQRISEAQRGVVVNCPG